MARVFVTGSTDGLGKMAAELLIEQGHNVALHARSTARAEETGKKVGGAEHILVGDLSSIEETKSVADQVNKFDRFDAVIHNAGIGCRPRQGDGRGDRSLLRGVRGDQRRYRRPDGVALPCADPRSGPRESSQCARQRDNVFGQDQ
jgi:NAD(P)-dependent dehydrogenase (short-subunit alcohol dehydrogenase family)